MTLLQRVQAVALGTGVTGCVLLGFAIPTSRALFNLAALLIIVGWVFSGQFAAKWRTIRQNVLFWPVVGIWAMLLVGALHTSAAWADVLEHWDRYSKFFLVLMVISLLTRQHHRLWMWWAFLAACLVVLVSTYLNIFFLLPWSKSQALGLGADHAVFIDHIAQSLVMALFAVVLWLKALRASHLAMRASLLLLCVAAVFSITHLTTSRIGYGVVLALAALMPLLSVPRKWAVIAAIASAASAVAVLVFSELAAVRVALVFNELASYRQGELFTSTGARLHMWLTALDIWMQAPWFGHGTAAYHDLAKAAFNNPAMCEIGCFHPHNQFLFIAVDHGLVGLLLFCAYLLAAACMAWRRDSAERALFLGFLSILFVDALAHGPLWLFMEAYFSFGVMALLAAGPSGLFKWAERQGNH